MVMAVGALGFVRIASGRGSGCARVLQMALG